MTHPTPLAKVVIAGGHAPVRTDPVSRRRTLLIVLAALLLILLVALAIYWVTRPADVLNVTDPVDKIVKFAMTTEWDKLPFDRRVMFMKQIDDKEDELDKAFQERKITRVQFWRGQNLAYFGKHVARLRKLAAMKPGSQEYEFQLFKYLPDRRKPPKQEMTPDLSAAEREALVREKVFVKIYPDTWPEAERRKWHEYHQMMDDREKAEERKIRDHKRLHRPERPGTGAVVPSPRTTVTTQPKNAKK